MPNLQETSKVTTDNERSADKLLIKALLPSALGIVICIILLCGTTFAWLNDSVQTGNSTLTAGNFGVTVSVGDTTMTGTSVELGGDGSYIVSIAKSGNTKGYAILSITKVNDSDNDSNSYPKYLIEFNGSDSDTAYVSITPGQDTFLLQVVPYWGTKNLSDSYQILPTTINLKTSKTETNSETASKTTTDNIENEKGGQ